MAEQAAERAAGETEPAGRGSLNDQLSAGSMSNCLYGLFFFFDCKQ